MSKQDQLFVLQADFKPAGDQPEAIAQLVDGINQGVRDQVLLGVTGSGKTFTMAQVIQALQRPALVLAPNKTLAAQLYSEFKGFFPNNAVEYFVSYYDYYQPEAYVPTTDTFIEKDASINDSIEQLRLAATKAILERRDTIIVASVSAIYGLGDPQSYLEMTLPLQQGGRIDQRTLIRRLSDIQYKRDETLLERGTYRVRGEVIDIHPAEVEDNALRVQLFDDEIEQLAVFDPLTGEILAKTSEYTIYPKNHYVTPRERLLSSVELIKEELRERLQALRAADKLLEAQRLEQRTRFDIEMMLELGYCSGIENYSRYLARRAAGEAPPTLFDYIPGEALLFIDESHVMVPQIAGMYRGDRARKTTLVEYGFRLPSALDNRPLMFEEFRSRPLPTIYVSATPGAFEQKQVDVVVEQLVRPTGLLDPLIEVRPADTQVDDLLSVAHQAIKRGQRVLVTTLTKRMAEDLSEFLQENGIAARYLHADLDTLERVAIIADLRAGVFDVLVGINLLREGLDMPEVAVVAILDADKEGFLRSARSLIQTIGRAARHLHGRAILYGDVVTTSMQQALDETVRRREAQQQYNKEHNITPKGIAKAVRLAIVHDEVAENKMDTKEVLVEQRLQDLTPLQLEMKVKQLSKEMKTAAKQLDFELAAQKRDIIKQLRGLLRLNKPS